MCVHAVWIGIARGLSFNVCCVFGEVKVSSGKVVRVIFLFKKLYGDFQ